MSNESTDTATTPTVQATLQPKTARLGDLLQLDIQVTHHAALTVEPFYFPKTLETFEVAASTQLPSRVSGEFVTEHFTAQLQNFATGPQLLPAIEIDYQDLERKTHALKTTPLQVTIQEVPAGPKDKGDIRGIVGVVGPVAWSPWWWLLLVIVVMGAAGYGFARRQKIIQGPPPPPPVPADEVAMKKLQELAAAGWVESGKLKEFYSALSDIVRAYLENGFQIIALERTTNELMRDLRKRGAFDPMLQTELKDLLESGDLVKFAKYRPTADEALKDHTAAASFVEKTRNALRQP